MNTAEQAYESAIQAIENNRLSDAIGQLQDFARRYSPSKEAAIRMQRSEWNALEEEALIMGETSGIRERRSSLKLQLIRLAEAIRKEARDAGPPPARAEQSPGATDKAIPPAQPATPRYDTAALRHLFRQGQPGRLIEQLITLTEGNRGFYDRSLLLEQQWKEISEDEKFNTASPDNISIRKNQLNKGLLELIRDMEGEME
ncbi:MAG: hypothetical protein KDC66_00240 [Phaeodactylibacter sp.]|nr:hypothetical protein [Phaeodactylibacter sp.]MCB9272800.1 hypothetical protein [Lewinellaceae bacterium]